MDVWKPGMEDEATPDLDDVPWSDDADGEPAEDEDAQYIPDHDPADWVDPHWLELRYRGAGEDRGSGQGDQSGGGGGEHHGSGDDRATGWADDIDEQVSGHASRLLHLQNIHRIAKTDIRGTIGDQLCQGGKRHREEV